MNIKTHEDRLHVLCLQQNNRGTRIVGQASWAGNGALHLELLLPWFDVGLQICSSLGGYRSIAGNVEENQIKSNIVGDEAQQHHWISPEAAALV